MNESIEIYIKLLEDEGRISPDCKSCIEAFYPRLREGQRIYGIFAPNHKPSSRCKSGSRPHCTCDTCF